MSLIRPYHRSFTPSYDERLTELFDFFATLDLPRGEAMICASGAFAAQGLVERPPRDFDVFVSPDVMDMCIRRHGPLHTSKFGIGRGMVVIDVEPDGIVEFDISDEFPGISWGHEKFSRRGIYNNGILLMHPRDIKKSKEWLGRPKDLADIEEAHASIARSNMLGVPFNGGMGVQAQYKELCEKARESQGLYTLEVA